MNDFVCDNTACKNHIQIHGDKNCRSIVRIDASGREQLIRRHLYRKEIKTCNPYKATFMEFFLCSTCHAAVEMTK